MNSNRRKRLRALCSKLQDIIAELDLLIEEEQDAFDNMPESLQDSERGEQMQEYIDTMETAKDEIDSTVSELEQVSE